MKSQETVKPLSSRAKSALLDNFTIYYASELEFSTEDPTRPVLKNKKGEELVYCEDPIVTPTWFYPEEDTTTTLSYPRSKNMGKGFGTIFYIMIALYFFEKNILLRSTDIEMLSDIGGLAVWKRLERNGLATFNDLIEKYTFHLPADIDLNNIKTEARKKAKMLVTEKMLNDEIESIQDRLRASLNTDNKDTLHV